MPLDHLSYFALGYTEMFAIYKADYSIHSKLRIFPLNQIILNHTTL